MDAKKGRIIVDLLDFWTYSFYVDLTWMYLCFCFSVLLLLNSFGIVISENSCYFMFGCFCYAIYYYGAFYEIALLIGTWWYGWLVDLFSAYHVV